MLDSKDFMKSPNIMRKNQLVLKSIDQDKDSIAEYSESIDFEEDDTNDNSVFDARKLPCLQSIAKRFKKKKVEETYASKLSFSMLSSVKGSMRASRIHSKRKEPSLKDSLMVSQMGSFCQPSPSNHLRKTIYLDDRNNII